MSYTKKGVGIVENLEKDNKKTFDNPCSRSSFLSS